MCANFTLMHKKVVTAPVKVKFDVEFFKDGEDMLTEAF